jgi:hypothetical protein
MYHAYNICARKGVKWQIRDPLRQETCVIDDITSWFTVTNASQMLAFLQTNYQHLDWSFSRVLVEVFSWCARNKAPRTDPLSRESSQVVSWIS